MLYALIEGLAGIVDQHKLYQRVRLSPRWIAAGRDEAEVRSCYGPSGAAFEYSFSHDAGKKVIECEVKGSASVDLHLLLPKGTAANSVSVNGKKVKHRNVPVEESPYVDASFQLRKKARVEIRYS